MITGVHLTSVHLNLFPHRERTVDSSRSVIPSSLRLIVGGRLDEAFDVVDESDHLCTIQTDSGFHISCDFPYCDAACIDKDPLVASVMNQVQRVLLGDNLHWLHSFVPKQEASIEWKERILHQLCPIQSLGTISHLHVVTKSNDFVVPHDAYTY